MDKVIQQALVKMRQSTKSEFPWQLDEPWYQLIYGFTAAGWSVYSPPASAQTFSTFALYSWNIDFMLPFPDSRMHEALKHIEGLVRTQSPDIATIVFLQECTQTDLNLIASSPWIQEHFLLSDLDDSNWTSGWYGTVTLIDQRVRVSASFRVHYEQTVMERDAFFTDIQLGSQTIRICNSHLESMAFEPPRRPHQMASAAAYMHVVHGAVIAGDFNAIQDFDRSLHAQNDLKDAYLQSGGAEDGEAGFTWGQQASTHLREHFGLSRMDKVFYCGALQLQSFQTFGADVQLQDKDEQEEVVALGFDKPWITDHLGVKAVFSIEDAIEAKT